MSSTDVLIVGAGPTGLTLALELSIQNIPFRIIDKLEAPSDKSRALAVQCRTQELLNRHPTVANEMLAKGVQGPGVNIYCNKKFLITGTFDDLGFDDTQFPLPIWIAQDETEAALTRQLHDYGGKIERGVAAEDIKQDADSTTVTLVSGNGAVKEVLTAKYMVGCDGAHSIVRKSTGLTFDGAQYPQEFILADVKITNGPYDTQRVSMFLGSRIMVIFPLKNGVVRVVGERSVGSKYSGNPVVQEIREFMQEMTGHTYDITDDPIWLTHFRWNCRGVNNYRDGRLFVAGDAAHIHSPAGGQGMNTGIQDAINLGWKMAAVLRGEKHDSFLDTYQEERHPVGQHILHGTDRMFNVVASQNLVVTYVRNALMPWIVPYVWGDKARRRRMFTFVSQMAVKYRRSSIVCTATGFEGPVKGGWRAPDGELVDERGEKGKWLLGLTSNKENTILIFSGMVGDEEEVTHIEDKILADKRYEEVGVVKVFGGRMMVTGGCSFRDKDGALHKRYGFEKGAGLVVVRPDGYVAFIGSGESVDEFLSL